MTEDSLTGKTYSYRMEAPVAQPPRRVVSLAPSLTESLFDLNLGQRVIAVTTACTRPAARIAALPRIGGPKTPDIQRIIDLRPDLALASQDENRPEDAAALQAAGIAVWMTFPQTAADALNLLWNIMYVFDEPSMVPRVRLIEQTMDWVAKISERRAAENPCKVFVPLGFDPLTTFSAKTYAHDVLRVCGGSNVFAESSAAYPQVSIEAVVAAQPDVILLPNEPGVIKPEHSAWLHNLEVPAARQKRIILVDGSLLTWPGTRLAHALDELPLLLCPDEK